MIESGNSKVYIIVLNWNGWKDTIECLESVFSNIYSNFQVIVCDNGSADGSLDKIKSWAEGTLDAPITEIEKIKELKGFSIKKPIKYVEYNREQAENGGDDSVAPTIPLVLIQTGDNLGYAGGNNVGLRYVLSQDDFEFVWLLNSDTVIERHSLVRLIEKMQENPRAGMCGSTVFYYYQPTKVQAFGGAVYNKWTGVPKLYGKTDRDSCEINEQAIEKKLYYILGASMLVSKSFLNDIGLISEDYFLYHEEIDWITRAKGKYNLAYASKSIVYHKEGGSTGSNYDMKKSSYLADFHMIKNRMIFTRKFFPWFLPTVYLGLFVTLINRIRRRQWDRVKMVLKIMLFKW